MNNLFSSLPESLDDEVFEPILEADHVRIERIVSKGHSSPAEGWYDQEEHEWVVVLEGAGQSCLSRVRRFTWKRAIT